MSGRPKRQFGLRPFELYKAEIRKPRELVFYYNISILYFMLEDFDKAMFWLVKILSHIQTHHRKDLQRFAQILQLFYHYELKNFDFLREILHTVKQKLNLKVSLNAWENFLFQILSSLIAVTTKHEIQKVCKAKLAQLQTKPYEASLGYGEIRIWLEKKIE